MSALLAGGLPFPDVPAIGPKYRFWQAHHDEYDVLFMGSSRFYHQIIPLEFDAMVGELTGRKVRSFNAAYDAVWPPESYYYLRRLLEFKPHRLQWVVIDAMDINPKLEALGQVTRRQAYWHDAAHTRMAVEAVWEGDRPPREKEELAAEHLVLAAREMVNFGRGAEGLRTMLLPVKQRASRPPEWSGAEGYHAGGVEGLTGKIREGFLTEVLRLSSDLEPAEPSPALARAMKGMVETVRGKGAEPVFVIAPTLNEHENLKAIPGEAPLLAFNDPRQYPVLFDPDLHYDGWHLNERGAHEFTRLLAQRFALLLSAPKP